VSAAASSLGFYEFGRFAGEYRAVFGSCPRRRSARALRAHSPRRRAAPSEGQPTRLFARDHGSLARANPHTRPARCSRMTQH